MAIPFTIKEDLKKDGKVVVFIIIQEIDKNGVIKKERRVVLKSTKNPTRCELFDLERAVKDFGGNKYDFKGIVKEIFGVNIEVD